MDWIAVAEAAYRVDAPIEGWLDGLIAAAAPELDAGLGCYGHVFRIVDGSIRVQALRGGGAFAGREEGIIAATESAPVDAVRIMFDAGIVAGCGTGILGDGPNADRFEELIASTSGGAMRDVVGVVANDDEGGGVAFAGGRAARGDGPDRTATARWIRISDHVAAGCRLVRRLSSGSSEPPDAVLETDGRLAHARGEAREKAHALREAALRMERARGPARRERPDEALELWRGLVAGRWSLVDRFESDGRRYLVAYRNEARQPDPRGLSSPETLIAGQLGRGRTIQEIAYALGVTPSAVSNAAHRVRRKLGLDSMVELVAFFAPGGVRARLVSFDFADADFAVASMPALEERLASLSAAEREVALALLEGRTYAAIAAARATSERTVANQAASLYRKLGVTSRCELAASVLAATSDEG